MPIRLVLADDHPVFLHGLEQIFRTAGDFAVVATCATGEEALEAMSAHHPDVLVLDVQLPGKDGLEVLRDLHREKLSSRVVLITASLSGRQVMQAIELGVGGILLKATAPRMIADCVRKVHAGGRWLDRDAMTRALDTMVKRETGMREAASVLTPRELEVVGMIVQGMRNKELAERLSVSEGTIKTHLHHVYEKLEVKGRVELILYAQEKGLV